MVDAKPAAAPVTVTVDAGGIEYTNGLTRVKIIPSPFSLSVHDPVSGTPILRGIGFGLWGRRTGRRGSLRPGRADSDTGLWTDESQPTGRRPHQADDAEYPCGRTGQTAAFSALGGHVFLRPIYRLTGWYLYIYAGS